MGYTHHFKRQSVPSPAAWVQITSHFKHVVAALPPYTCTAGGYYNDEPLAINYDFVANSKPVMVGNHSLLCDDELILFNGGMPKAHLAGPAGQGYLGHETFVLERSAEQIGFGHFCKTARKPYDLAVCAALLIVETEVPGYWSIGSDGDRDDWLPAAELLDRVIVPVYASNALDRIVSAVADAM